MNSQFPYFIQSDSLENHEKVINKFNSYFFNTPLFFYLEDKMIDGTDDDDKDFSFYLNLPIDSTKCCLWPR